MSSAAPAKKRSKDRHRKRHMIGFKPEFYALLKRLADRNYRPVGLEVRRILEIALVEAGLLSSADTRNQSPPENG